MEGIAVTLSASSLLLSIFTAWATLLRGGTLKMTRPAVIYFGPDGGRKREPKVFLRALLFTTGNKGRIIEGMFIKLHRGESSQAFNIWVHGATGRLERGSGLKVDSNGVTFNHHFLLPENAREYQFLPGDYQLELYALVLGESRPRRLFLCDLSLTPEQVAAIRTGESGVYFDWGPNSQAYHASVHESRLRSEALEEAIVSAILPGLSRSSKVPSP